MARKVRNSRLESRSARLKLPVRFKPYTGASLARGIMLLYRRNRGNGTWVVKASDGHGAYWTKAFAQADDFEDADGMHVLTFYQAQEQAKLLARGKTDTPDHKPVTVADALDRYEADLKSRGRATGNVSRVRAHLTGALAAKPVGLLSVLDLRSWRDGLLAGLTPATINRTCTGLRATLELAATLDYRITNRHVFKIGLKRLPGANKARRMVLPDADVLRIVEAAYQIDEPFGLLAEVLAVTGARVSQVARLTCGDLQADRSDPRLLIPPSYKGRGTKIVERVPVPIPQRLAIALQSMRADRPSDAPLLVKADGTRWQATDKGDHRDLFRAAVEQAGLDPDQITSYALRHSAIVRSLLKGVPVSIVARSADTSVREIESHYGRYINDFADQLTRAALLDVGPPADLPVVAANVVPLVKR
jgi:integrase